MSYAVRFAVVIMFALVLGCARDPGKVDETPQASPQASAAQVRAQMPVDALQARAEAALRERRYYAPVGDSAIDHYLALRERKPDQPGVTAALTELQPYLLIAGEQALAGGDLVEAQRLLTLLARVDADAPALPRLREGLDRARLAQQTGASEAAAARAAQEGIRAADQAGTRAVIPTTVPAGTATPALAVAAPVADPSAPPLPSPQPPAVRSPPSPRITQVGVSAPPKPASSVPGTMPRLLRDSPPRYPLTALNRKIEGSVDVAFTIQPDGSVAGLRLVSANPSGVFDAAALAAVARWRFEATGQPVNTQRTLNFRLPNG